jgi:hypothetical protein
MTDHHNKLVRSIKNIIEEHIPEDLVGGIYENTPIQADNLSEETRNQRPDMWFVRKERNQHIIEILEFSSPFGRMEND